jgi:hypothetical protein
LAVLSGVVVLLLVVAFTASAAVAAVKVAYDASRSYAVVAVIGFIPPSPSDCGRTR